MSRALAVVIGALACSLLGPSAAQAGFYDPPSPLPGRSPGDVIRAEPMQAYDVPGVALPGRAWRVLYRSQTATGAPVAVSGTVLVPEAQGTGPQPLIGYAIGSQGLADRCAPSQQLAAGTEYEADLIRQVLARGWAIALTDYQGLGPPGEHPYNVGRATGRDVLDAMRAARRLPAAGLPARGPLGLIGYSEGGGASGWAAQLQRTYAPDLPLTGAAVGGVVADIEKIDPAIEGSPFSFLLSYVFSGFDTAYPDLDLPRLLNERGKTTVARVKGTCINEGPTVDAFSRSSDLTTVPPLSYGPFVRRLRENRLGSIAPQTPVLLQHARADNILPYEQAVQLSRDWCALGVNVRFKDAVGADHISGGFGAIGPAIDFLDARFAGTPLPQPAGCARPHTARATVVARVVRRGRAGRRAMVVRLRPVGGVLSRVQLAVRSARGKLLGRRAVGPLRRARRVRVRIRRTPRAGARYPVAVRAVRTDGSRLRRVLRLRMPRR